MDLSYGSHSRVLRLRGLYTRLETDSLSSSLYLLSSLGPLGRSECLSYRVQVDDYHRFLGTVGNQLRTGLERFNPSRNDATFHEFNLLRKYFNAATPMHSVGGFANVCPFFPLAARQQRNFSFKRGDSRGESGDKQAACNRLV